MMRELIIEILKKLEKSNYVDSAEHLYDAIKEINRHINDDNLNYYIPDFLFGLESSTVLDCDGVVKECSNLIHKYIEYKNKDKIIKGKVIFELDKPDINGNIWTTEATEKAVADYKKRYMTEKADRAYGELEHGEYAQVNLVKVSHKLTDLRIEDGQLICDVEILDTPMGKIAVELHHILE